MRCFIFEASPAIPEIPCVLESIAVAICSRSGELRRNVLPAFFGNFLFHYRKAVDLIFCSGRGSAASPALTSKVERRVRFCFGIGGRAHGSASWVKKRHGFRGVVEGKCIFGSGNDQVAVFFDGGAVRKSILASLGSVFKNETRKRNIPATFVKKFDEFVLVALVRRIRKNFVQTEASTIDGLFRKLRLWFFRLFCRGFPKA